MLSPSDAQDPLFVERFRREARAAAGLNHPNIVAVFDSGSDAQQPYLVMEYVPGGSLAQVLARQAGWRPAGPSSWPSRCARPGRRHARGYLATTAQVHRLAAHHAQSPARLDPISAQAAAHHPATHARLGGDQPPPPTGGGHTDPAPAGPGGWTPPQVGGADPEVARLLAVLANAGPAGLTVTELLVATGRQKTWVYDRLAELQQAALVERVGQGRYRLRRPPTGGREAVS